MDASKLKPNREFESVAIRFLKETRLLGYWKKYVKIYRLESLYGHWSNKRLIEFIFSATSFTNFVASEKRCRHWRYCIFELFIYWLKLNNYNFALTPREEKKLKDESYIDDISKRLIIDENTKKVTLDNFY